MVQTLTPNILRIRSLNQLSHYYSFLCTRPNFDRAYTKHSQDREAPLPIYLGILLHTKTRKNHLLTLFSILDCAFHMIVCWIFQLNLEASFAITMMLQMLSVLLISKETCLQQPQLITLITIRAPLAHTMLSMVLEYL